MKTIKQRQMKIELMLNIIKARADNMKGGELINLDVEGFIIEEMVNDNMIDSDSDNDNEIDTNTENIT